MNYVQTRSRAGVSWIFALYLIVGAIVAATHNYWSNLQDLKDVISAMLATLLWPLLLLGINLHVH
jgi:phosphotransferase system  glucose/maltose/N-acetylglucosamine-specific IIC component